jgi:hypothetical protein
MKLKLEFRGNTVLLTAPPVESKSSIAHEALMAGNMSRVLADPSSVWSYTESTTVELPFDSWRHLIGQIHRRYQLHADRTSKNSGVVMSPMMFEVAGVEYATPKEIPLQSECHAEIGRFNLSQPKLLAIDAGSKTGCGTLLQALPGAWIARVLYRDEASNGHSAALLTVSHDSFEGDTFDRAGYLPRPGGWVEVESGTCGFFDYAKYASKEVDETGFNGRLCKAAAESRSDGYDVSKKYPAGILSGHFGVNSRTFFGNGAYDVLAIKNETGQVMAACLVFEKTKSGL